MSTVVETVVDLKREFLASEQYARLKEALEEHGIEITIAGVGAGVVVMGLYGSALVTNAVILAVTTTAGLALIASKLPRRVQRTLVKYGFVTDTAAAVGTYFVLGSTVTSLLAAALVGVFTSIGIWACKPFLLETEEQPEVRIEFSLA